MCILWFIRVRTLSQIGDFYFTCFCWFWLFSVGERERERERERENTFGLAIDTFFGSSTKLCPTGEFDGRLKIIVYDLKYRQSRNFLNEESLRRFITVVDFLKSYYEDIQLVATPLTAISPEIWCFGMLTMLSHTTYSKYKARLVSELFVPLL